MFNLKADVADVVKIIKGIHAERWTMTRNGVNLIRKGINLSFPKKNEAGQIVAGYEVTLFNPQATSPEKVEQKVRVETNFLKNGADKIWVDNVLQTGSIVDVDVHFGSLDVEHYYTTPEGVGVKDTLNFRLSIAQSLSLLSFLNR